MDRLGRAMHRQVGRDQPPAREQQRHRIAARPQRRRRDARAQLVGREIARAVHQHRQLVGIARLPPGRGAAPPREDLLQHRQRRLVRTLAAEQLVEQRAVERQQCRPRLRARRVVAVHRVDDEAELQRRREGRRDLGAHHTDRQRARRHASEHVAQPLQVERVLQHVAVRLDEDRERRELAHRLQQVERLQPLQPERHAPPRVAARQQQRTGGVHAEARAEQRRRPDLLQHQLLRLGRAQRPERRPSAARRPCRAGAA